MHAVIIYGFPVILVVFEWGIRTVIGVDTFAFVGPTLAAASLCFLVALTKPKQVSNGYYRPTGDFVEITKNDNRVIPFTWLLILAGLFAWSASCVISNRTPNDVIYIFGGTINTQFFIGLCCYIVSIVMTIIKEVA